MSPTGYTADLYEGNDVTFEEFVLKCASAFGALIEMRDSSLDVTIPDVFEPSTYHQERIEEARARLARVEAWTPEEAENAAKADYQRARTAWEENRASRAAMKERYEAMLEQVNVWTPPTTDHDNLKKFMREQLEQSIDHDTDMTFYKAPTLHHGEVFKAQEIARAKRDLAYHQEHHEQEVQRAKERTEWVSELRRSLEGIRA